MRSLEFYKGREQTYVKHIFLERYLEQVAYNIFSFMDDFVYVDGFAGPWRSKDENFSDTSFFIAVQTLRSVRDAMKEKRHKRIEVRCVFVDKAPDAFADLEKFVATVRDMRVESIHGEFETVIPRLVKLIGRSFSLVFIDPTGWTGFGLQAIQPLLQLRGEVLITFMFNDINRFLVEPGRAKAASYNSLYGGPEWFDEFRDLTHEGWSREDAVLEVYRRRVQRFGNFAYVTSTRVKSPGQDRTYFHLVYATRSWKGINVFRSVEEKAASEQEMAGAVAKDHVRTRDDRQTGLFDHLPVAPGPRVFEEEQRVRLHQGQERLRQVLRSVNRIRYKELSAEVQQVPLVWEHFLKDWLADMYSRGEIRIDGLRGRSRRPNRDCIITVLGC